MSYVDELIKLDTVTVLKEALRAAQDKIIEQQRRLRLLQKVYEAAINLDLRTDNLKASIRAYKEVVK